jgi:hypothetical protein
MRFLLFAHSKLLFQVVQDVLCVFTSVEMTEDILLRMKLFQIILHLLDCSVSVVPVLYHMVSTLRSGYITRLL